MISGSVLTWDEVQRRHCTRTAVRFENGLVISILCGHDHYDDQIFNTHVIYRVPKRGHYNRALAAMEGSSKHNRAFTVFRKLGKNRWEDLGPYSIADVRQTERFTEFHLRPADSPIQFDTCSEASLP